MESQPVAANSCMHASTNGSPVVPERQRSNASTSCLPQGVRPIMSHTMLRGAGLPLAITLSGGYAATPHRTAQLHASVFREAVRVG